MACQDFSRLFLTHPDACARSPHVGADVLTALLRQNLRATLHAVEYDASPSLRRPRRLVFQVDHALVSCARTSSRTWLVRRCDASAAAPAAAAAPAPDAHADADADADGAVVKGRGGYLVRVDAVDEDAPVAFCNPKTSERVTSFDVVRKMQDGGGWVQHVRSTSSASELVARVLQWQECTVVQRARVRFFNVRLLAEAIRTAACAA